jgi:NAD(P)-dependent dehydrogenase (short-subunit alcohol dehydrogenase family)
MNRLAGRVCFVTGSTGIAAASAERLAGEGASVFITSRSEDHCREIVDRIVAGGARAAYRVADLADEQQVGDAVDACVAAFGRIDGLFSVAGGSGRRFGDGPIHEVSGDAWDATLALNLRTQALVCGAVVRQMLAQEPNGSGTRGSILLMGSVTATDPVPAFFATHAYAAAKGAIAALMTTMAATYAADRIRVNAVAPGLTDTPMAARAAGNADIRAFAARKQPLAGEIMDPIDVAHAAVYFLSDESRAVTGQLLKVDGGWSVISVSPEPR